MNSADLIELIRRLMECPAAPYHEFAVRSAIESIAQEHGLCHGFDRFGNLIIKTGTIGRPIVLAAHMDHPGFVIKDRLDATSWSAEFLGGVPDKYFVPGIPLRIFPNSIACRLGAILDPERRVYKIEIGSEVKEASFAVWDLPCFTVRDSLILGRACDDLIGVAAALATLIELKRRDVTQQVYAVFTRAEEVGFGGAIAAAKHRIIPDDSFVISLETSRELPPVTIGQGVIVRIGDKASVFDSAGTRYLTEISSKLLAANSGFQFQKALMSGGTCEATAYQEYGYTSAALCVALGNYHNCSSEKIDEEFVHQHDVETMVSLLVEASIEFSNFSYWTNKLRVRLDELSLQTEPRLIV